MSPTITSTELESLTRDHAQLDFFRRELRATFVQADQDAKRFLSRRLSDDVLRGFVALMEIQTEGSRRLFLACKRIREGRESEPLPEDICHPRATDEEPRRAIERILGEWRELITDLDALVFMSKTQLEAALERAAQ